MATFFYIGLILVVIASIWLAALGGLTGRSTAEKIAWVLLNLIFQPLAGIIFLIARRRGLIPVLLAVVGTIMILVTYREVARNTVGTIPL
jgi:hypothetical protein